MFSLFLPNIIGCTPKIIWFKRHGVSAEWVDLFLLVELHCKGFASAPCAGGLFIKRTPQLFFIKLLFSFVKLPRDWLLVKCRRRCGNLATWRFLHGFLFCKWYKTLQHLSHWQLARPVWYFVIIPKQSLVFIFIFIFNKKPNGNWTPKNWI